MVSMFLREFCGGPFTGTGAPFTPVRMLPCMLRLLAALHVTIAMATAPTPRVVINEIHFDPADKRPLEFVELHNPGSADIQLDGWTLQKFAFPPNTTLPAGRFVVVAQ